MLDTKRFNAMLETGRAKREAHNAKIAVLARKHGEAEREHLELQQRLRELCKRMADYEQGVIELRDSDYADVRRLIDLTKAKVERAGEKRIAAKKALNTAEDDAGAELSKLRSEALYAWKYETFAAGEEYTKDWLRL